MRRFLSARLPWQTLDDPARRIETSLDDRTQRLMAGVSVADDFARVDASLIVTVGHGKYLRVRHVETETQGLPSDLSDRWQQLAASPLPEVQEYRQLAADLSLVQAALFQRLKCRAGKYVDRILAVAVTDPGLRRNDFDGRPICYGLCDATSLGQLTGVSVIDDFPAADIAAGGCGMFLEALPLWLMFADRSKIVSDRNVLTLQLNNRYAGYWLPPSDGLDAELPAIRRLAAVPGVDFLNRLANALELESTHPQRLASVYAEGQFSECLSQAWDRVWEKARHAGQNEREIDMPKVIDRMLSVFSELRRSKNLCPADGIRTAIVWVIAVTIQQLQERRQDADEIRLMADTVWHSCLIHRLMQATEDDRVAVTSSQVFAAEDQALAGQAVGSDSTVAAILGILHIDQMPANVPFITGAREQRLLGRLTPGKPSNWRQLLRHMSDFQPPAMKLRDAV